MRWHEPSILSRTHGDGTTRRLVVEVTDDGSVATEPLEGAEPGDGDILLGVMDDAVWYARPAAELSAAGTNFRWTPSELVATASSLVRWHASNPVCESCRSETVPDAGGRRRRCTACGELLFCRMDPAVIVGITDTADRLLLARQRTWEEGRMSVIAGFVEPGESLEQACAREALEEVNLQLREIRYFGSQPWPFPRSLMLGFTARVDDPGELLVDEVEIVEATFLTRSELHARVEQGRVILPGGASIGRALIDHWHGGPLAG